MSGLTPSNEDHPLHADIVQLQAQLAEAITRQIGVSEDQLLSAVFQASPAAIGTCTGREITMVNARFTEMLGYTTEESVGQSTRFVYPDDEEYERVGKLLYNPLHDKPSFAVSATLQRKDGLRIRAMVCAAPLVPGKPEAGITFVLLDITHTEGLAESLRERTAQLEAAQQLANLGSWSYDLTSGKISWSDHLFTLFGRDPSQGVPNIDEHGKYIHPDDRARTMDTFAEAINRGEGYDIQYRVVHPDGTTRHLKTIAAVEENTHGQVVRLFGTTQDVTDQVHMVEMLQRARRIVEDSPAVFFRWRAELGWPVDFVTDNVRQFGYEPDALLSGRTPFTNLVHPDDIDRVNQEVQDHLQRGDMVYHQEYRILTADGQTRWVDDRTRVERDQADTILCIEGVLLDITDRRRAQEALLQSEQRYRRLFNAGCDAVFVHTLGPDGSLEPFTDVNDAACMLTGYSRDELLSMTPADLDLYQPEKLPDIVGNLMEQGHDTIRSIHTRKDGSTYHAEVTANAFQLNNGQWQVLSAVRDISERIKIQEQIQQTQKLESLGVLAGGIAHDFNNLLMGIMGNADLALMELSKVSPARENVEEIKAASARAADLCRQMLAYSGKGRFVIEPINLSEVVEEMTHMLEVSISKNVVLKFNFGENLPATRVDVTQIRQVIMNLITNASEAIGERSGVVSITTGTMACDKEYLEETYIEDDLAPGLYLTLEVADTGCGMDEETLHRIFEPFYTTKFTGRGLGLAAVLGIVRGHKGAIKIYSEPGQGTTVRLLLPACEDAPPPPKSTSPTPRRARSLSARSSWPTTKKPSAPSANECSSASAAMSSSPTTDARPSNNTRPTRSISPPSSST
jgi:PAS domain S-box-containing protein